MSRKRLMVCTMTAVVVSHFAAGEAFGDDLTVEATPNPTTPLAGFLHFLSPFELHTDGGTSLRLPPGYYLDETKFQRLDGDLRVLQDRVVRLDAENKSLRASASGWQPGWKMLLGALVVGATSSWYLSSRF